MHSSAVDLFSEHLPTDTTVPKAKYDSKTDPIDAVRACEELPLCVRNAKFTQVSERHLDAVLFSNIVSQSPSSITDDGWAERLQRRYDALHPHMNKMLMCVFVRLPGVHYTVEVDAETCEVVYWEWQTD